jgi:hypothetical protein
VHRGFSRRQRHTLGQFNALAWPTNSISRQAKPLAATTN